MNRKYIDFVPSSGAGNGVRRAVSPRRRVTSEIREEGIVVTMPDAGSVSRTRVFRNVSMENGKVVSRNEGVKKTNLSRGSSDGVALRGHDDANKDDVWDYEEDVVWGDETTMAGTKESSEPERDYDESFSISRGPKLGVIEDYNPKFVSADVPKRPLYDEPKKKGTMADTGAKSVASRGQDEIEEIKSKKVKRGLFGRGRKEANVLAQKKTESLARANTAKVSVTGSAELVGTKGASSRGTGLRGETSGSVASKGVGRRGVTTKETNAAKLSNNVDFSKKRHTAKGGSTFVPPRSPFINQEKVVKRPLSSKNVYQKVTPPSKEESKGPVTIISNSEKDSKVGLVVTIILTIILGAAAGTVAFLLLPK